VNRLRTTFKSYQYDNKIIDSYKISKQQIDTLNIEIHKLEYVQRTPEGDFVISELKQKRKHAYQIWESLENKHIDSALHTYQISRPYSDAIVTIQEQLNLLNEDIQTLSNWETNTISQNRLKQLHKLQSDLLKHLKKLQKSAEKSEGSIIKEPLGVLSALGIGAAFTALWKSVGQLIAGPFTPIQPSSPLLPGESPLVSVPPHIDVVAPNQSINISSSLKPNKFLIFLKGLGFGFLPLVGMSILGIILEVILSALNIHQYVSTGLMLLCMVLGYAAGCLLCFYTIVPESGFWALFKGKIFQPALSIDPNKQFRPWIIAILASLAMMVGLFFFLLSFSMILDPINQTVTSNTGIVVLCLVPLAGIVVFIFVLAPGTRFWKRWM
jgi:hypothetical protein